MAKEEHTKKRQPTDRPEQRAEPQQGQAGQRSPTAPQEAPQRAPGQPGGTEARPRGGAETREMPQQIQRVLRGADFPANRQQIIEAAQKNQAPEEVLRELKQLPDNRYGGAQEVVDAYQRQH